MNNRDIFFSMMKREANPVLSWVMAFFNDTTAKKLLGEENVPEDCRPNLKFNTHASDKSDWDKKIRYTKASGNFAIGVGWGNSIAFGHGGPGEFAERLTETGENYSLSEFETGVKKKVQIKPHFYHHYDYPVNTPEDIKKLCLPNPNDPARYTGIEEETAYYKEKGFITFGNVNGFFSGLHYFLYPYDTLLADMLLEPSMVEEMLEIVGNFNLAASENLLKRGVDMITFCDDLGSGSSMLISPELYREFFLPWHKKLASLCHRYGAFLHMHSHGNINKIMDDIYESGIDLLNPNDPQDGMDLCALKKKYGDKIIFVGGIDKFFYEWHHQKQKVYLEELVEKTGGGFILMDSGGVPENVKKEEFDGILEIFNNIKTKTGGKV